ncbi:MAG: hypothetical protein Kow00108_00560 [Calditrichia bacterium]
MNQFRWWYLEIISNDQIWIIVLYDHPFYLSFPIFLVDINLYQNNEKYHLGIPYSAKNGVNIQGKNSLQWVDGYFYQSDDRWNLNFTHEKTSLQLQIETLIPGDGKIHPIYDEGNEYFLWKPILPHGNVKGKIKFQGKTHSINGHAYIDYNEGCGSLKKRIRSWNWHKKRSDKSIKIASDIILRNKKRVAIRTSFVHNDSESVPDFNFSSLKGALPIDEVSFYITPLPNEFLLFRKIDEFLFYSLEEKFPANALNRLRSNVFYKRYYKKIDNGEITGEVIRFA